MANKLNQLCTYREFVLSVHAMHRSLSELENELGTKLGSFDATNSGALDLQAVLAEALELDPRNVDLAQLEAFIQKL